jgi:drug/metabolite transporter (DMT)-like permease
VHLIAGVAAAVVASALFNAGLVLQAQAARREPVGTGAAGLVGTLVLRRRWWVGTVLAVLGWPFQALALTQAALTVVQPTLAVGLVIPLVFGARYLGDDVRRRDAFAVAVVVAGVSLLVVAAPAERAGVEGPLRLAATLTILAGLGVGALALSSFAKGRRGVLLVVAAGIGYAWGSVATKLVADAVTRSAWLVMAAWAVAAAIAGCVGLAGEMNALQVRAAGGVASMVFALETLVPVGISPVLFGESWSGGPQTLVLRVAGLVATVGGATVLTRSQAVVDARHGDVHPHSTRTAAGETRSGISSDAGASR